MFLIDSILLEIRTLQEHYYITKYLSQCKHNSLWWIGATDATPEAPNEGVFVWMSDKSEIKHLNKGISYENQEFDFNVSNENIISLWGPGQPDNWPNQVRL